MLQYTVYEYSMVIACQCLSIITQQHVHYTDAVLDAISVPESCDLLRSISSLSEHLKDVQAAAGWLQARLTAAGLQVGV